MGELCVRVVCSCDYCAIFWIRSTVFVHTEIGAMNYWGQVVFMGRFLRGNIHDLSVVYAIAIESCLPGTTGRNLLILPIQVAYLINRLQAQAPLFTFLIPRTSFPNLTLKQMQPFYAFRRRRRRRRFYLRVVR